MRLRTSVVELQLGEGAALEPLGVSQAEGCRAVGVVQLLADLHTAATYRASVFHRANPLTNETQKGTGGEVRHDRAVT